MLRGVRDVGEISNPTTTRPVQRLLAFAQLVHSTLLSDRVFIPSYALSPQLPSLLFAPVIPSSQCFHLVWDVVLVEQRVGDERSLTTEWIDDGL